jgi:hypothetical protein
MSSVRRSTDRAAGPAVSRRRNQPLVGETDAGWEAANPMDVKSVRWPMDI